MQVETFVEMFEMEIVHQMGRNGTIVANKKVALSGLGRNGYEKRR